MKGLAAKLLFAFVSAGYAQWISLWQPNMGTQWTTEKDAGGQTSIEVYPSRAAVGFDGEVGVGGFAVAKTEFD
eukprot:721610-Karenia_brevis.AAC.1